MDIYFEPGYGKLYEKIESGTSEIFEFKSPLGRIRNMFIKRQIPFEIDGKTYYDIITPYGYGGPLIMECEEGRADKLVEGYEKEFQDYCNESKIVCEFVRFHPIVGNAWDFMNCYAISHIRNTIGTSLAVEDPTQSEFSKNCRKKIRRNDDLGIDYRIACNPSNLQGFKNIYYSTMDRNHAADYYFFGDEYFAQCLAQFGRNIVIIEAIYQGQTIAMELCFLCDKTIHIHLSGTLSNFLDLSPAYTMRYAIALWGKENGYELIHHGGGRSNAPDDNLYRFKKQFGKAEFPFCVGKKLWNAEVYKRLCQAANADEAAEFFPAYRAVKGE